MWVEINYILVILFLLIGKVDATLLGCGYPVIDVGGSNYLDYYSDTCTGEGYCDASYGGQPAGAYVSGNCYCWGTCSTGPCTMNVIYFPYPGIDYSVESGCIPESYCYLEGDFEYGYQIGQYVYGSCYCDRYTDQIVLVINSNFFGYRCDCPVGRYGYNCEYAAEVCYGYNSYVDFGHSGTGKCLSNNANMWGQNCDQQCANCPASPGGWHCDAGPNGNGQCKCPLANSVYRNGDCVVNQHCGLSRLCSGHGSCVDKPENAYEYCVCENGWTGIYCDQPYALYDMCDCGVQWENKYKGADVFRSQLPSNLEILKDFTGTPYLLYPLDDPIASPFRRPPITLPVSGPDQAKSICYGDYTCKGFVIWPDAAYWTRTGQVSTTFVYKAMFFTYGQNDKNTYIPNNPNDNPLSMYLIHRSQFTRCTDNSISISYLKTISGTVSKAVDYCAHHQNEINDGVPRICSIGALDLDYWVERYYRYEGHTARIAPNSGCNLLPVVYDSTKYCEVPRCPRVSSDSPPCYYNDNRQGYCEFNETSSRYNCVCDLFDWGSELDRKDQPKYIGRACEFPTGQYCATQTNPVLCSGFIDRCRPKPEWNDLYYADSAPDLVLNYTQFQPACDCAGLPYSGQFCQISQCGLDACKTLSAGDCVVINQHGDYGCVCTQFAIGNKCQISAANCLFNNLKCSGRGECREANVNHTQPYCECQDGYFGDRCELSRCSSDLIVYGHGPCQDGIKVGCYPPYSGQRCEVDNCAGPTNQWMGTIYGNPLPAGCNCTNNCDQYFQGQITVPSTCWPQCPMINGSLCGESELESPHACIQSHNEENTQRFATCSCAHGYVEVINPLFPVQAVCERYCIHGTVSSTWIYPDKCDCYPGYTNNDGQSPRCDELLCLNNGTFNSTTMQCDCNPPFLQVTNCKTTLCGKSPANGLVVDWTTDRWPLSTKRCFCPIPYSPVDIDVPFDCGGNLCGKGTVNKFWNRAIHPLSSACFCTGLYQTECTDIYTNCSFCTSSTLCKNGATIKELDPFSCNCTHIYTGQLCDANRCAKNGTAKVADDQCYCKFGFTGDLCQIQLCLNGILSDTNCTCSTGFSGMFCDHFIIPDNPNHDTGSSSSFLTTAVIVGIAASGTFAILTTVLGSVYYRAIGNYLQKRFRPNKVKYTSVKQGSS